MVRVRIYTDYLIDDEDGTLSKEEIINRAYNEMDKEVERGYFCLDNAEIFED